MKYLGINYDCEITSIGIFDIHKGKFFRDMLSRIDTIVATTSANKSGQSDVKKAEDMDPEIIKAVDLVLVDNTKIYFPKTTKVVRLKNKIEILRPGAVGITHI